MIMRSPDCSPLVPCPRHKNIYPCRARCAAQDAITSMNGKQLHGRTVTVELSGRPPKDGVPPPGRGGGGFRDEPRGDYGGGPPSRGGPSNDMATRNLFVGNIPPDVSESDVQHHFSKFGNVTGVKFLPKKSDTIAAFVDFHSVEDARDAHDALNMLGGMKLRTDYNNRGARPPAPRDDRYDDRPPPRYDDRYDDRPPPAPRYDDRYDDRPPPAPRYDERPPPRYEERGPPPPQRYDDRYDDRPPPAPRYDDRYDDRPPPAPRYDERPPPRYEERGPPPPQRYDDRYDDRGPPPPQRYDDRRGPPERERDYYDERRGPPPPQRYDDRGPPPPRYDQRPYAPPLVQPPGVT